VFHRSINESLHSRNERLAALQTETLLVGVLA
jgi:hypothetical protein